MKQVPLILVSSIALAFGVGTAQAQQTSPSPAPQAQQAQQMPTPKPASAEQVAKCGKIATSIAGSLKKDDFDGATQRFSSKLKEMLPASKLETGWKSLVGKYGKAESVGSTDEGQRVNDFTVVVVPMQFEKARMGAQVVCSDAGKVAGLRIGQMPGNDPAGKGSAPKS